jgi:hypothetical protein
VECQWREIRISFPENPRYIIMLNGTTFTVDDTKPILDDRFIAKELSRAELETMAAFGPAYFDYMSSAVTADVSTVHFYRESD